MGCEFRRTTDEHHQDGSRREKLVSSALAAAALAWTVGVAWVDFHDRVLGGLADHRARLASIERELGVNAALERATAERLADLAGRVAELEHPR